MDTVTDLKYMTGKMKNALESQLFLLRLTLPNLIKNFTAAQRVLYECQKQDRQKEGFNGKTSSGKIDKVVRNSKYNKTVNSDRHPK